MCQSMADIQSPTAQIRRGKKDRKKIEITGQNIMASLIHRAAIIKAGQQGTITDNCPNKTLAHNIET